MKVVKKAREFVARKVGEKPPASGRPVQQQRARVLVDKSLLTLGLCLRSREIPSELTGEVIRLSRNLHQFGLLPAPTAIKPSEQKAVRTLHGHFLDLAAKVHADEPGPGGVSDASLKMHLGNWMEFFPEKAMKKLPQSVRLHFDLHFPDLKNSCSERELTQFKETFKSMEQALSAYAL